KWWDLKHPTFAGPDIIGFRSEKLRYNQWYIFPWLFIVAWSGVGALLAWSVMPSYIFAISRPADVAVFLDAFARTWNQSQADVADFGSSDGEFRIGPETIKGGEAIRTRIAANRRGAARPLWLTDRHISYADSDHVVIDGRARFSLVDNTREGTG